MKHCILRCLPDGEGSATVCDPDTQANESMVKIHDRMPLIIKEEQIEEWLGGMEGCKALLGQVPEKLKKSMEYEQQAFEFN